MAMSDYGDDGMMGGNGWWIVLLFILLGGWGGRGAEGANSVGGNELYPWMEMQQNQMNGFSSLSQQICNGFANAETAATARQLADMQQAFAAQTAMMQGFNAQQAQLAQCCCDNRLATANLQADIARENCADRAAVSDGIRDILVNANSNTQRIIDLMCQDKIDAKNEEIANLRQQINMMNLAASQEAQTSKILADNFAQTNALEQYLAPVPRPAYVVQNPNCCQQQFGCGM